MIMNKKVTNDYPEMGIKVEVDLDLCAGCCIDGTIRFVRRGRTSKNDYIEVNYMVGYPELPIVNNGKGNLEERKLALTLIQPVVDWLINKQAELDSRPMKTATEFFNEMAIAIDEAHNNED